MHFYHLRALDWVDVVSALKADPQKTSTLAQSLSSYPQSSPGHFKDVQTRLARLVQQDTAREILREDDALRISRALPGVAASLRGETDLPRHFGGLGACRT